jgi:carboxylesterase type B
MVQGEGGGGGGGGGMSAGEIKKLFAQFKNDMKPMITDIAERLSENKVVNLKRITDLYEQTNEKDKKMIVQKLEDQMLVISNHLKKKIDKMNTDFED